MRAVVLVIIVMMAGCIDSARTESGEAPSDFEEEPNRRAQARPETTQVGNLTGTGPAFTNAEIQAFWDDLQDGRVQLSVTDTRSDAIDQIYLGVRPRDQIVVDLTVEPWQSNSTVPFITHDSANPWWATWQGSAGTEPSLARVVVTESWARVSVRVDHELYRGYIGEVPEPAEIMDAAGPGATDSAEPGVGCQQSRPSKAPLGQGPVHFQGERLDGFLALDVDQDFVSRWGPTAVAQAVAYAAEADLIFDDQAGVRLHIAGIHVAPTGTYPPSGAETPLTDLRNHWATHSLSRDAVLLLQPMEGQSVALGQVYCSGAFGFPNDSFAHAYTGPDGTTGYYLAHINTVAHELGHLFFASHDDGDTNEGRTGTIMPGPTPRGPFHDISTIFSAQTRPVIRAVAEERLLPAA